MAKVFDLFAGAGGFGLGFRLANCDVSFSIEIDKWAVETLQENQAADSIILHDDIRKYQTKEQVLQATNSVVPEIIIGGPPCQGFSIAAPSHRKDPKDPRNSLFKDFARWVDFLRPRVFVMENVKGILSRHNAHQEKVIDIIRRTFEDLDYSVEIWKLNAVKYGVPQVRERVFIVGNALNKTIGEPPVPSNKQAIKVWEAISDLPKLEAGGGKEEQVYAHDPSTLFQKWARGKSRIVHNHVAMKHREVMVDRFKSIHWNHAAPDAPAEYQARKRNGNGEMTETAYDSNNRRLYPFAPSYTIPAHFYSSFIHPYQHRNITAREAARLQSFPDSYVFKGKRTVVSRKLLEKLERHEENFLSQYNQIGNAVPPLLAKAIAEHLLEFLENA